MPTGCRLCCLASGNYDTLGDASTISHSYHRYSTRNNHDDRKRMYSSEDAADNVIARMQSQGVTNGHRLVSYFNEERNGWYVGNSNLL